MYTLVQISFFWTNDFLVYFDVFGIKLLFLKKRMHLLAKDSIYIHKNHNIDVIFTFILFDHLGNSVWKKYHVPYVANILVETFFHHFNWLKKNKKSLVNVTMFWLNRKLYIRKNTLVFIKILQIIIISIFLFG